MDNLINRYVIDGRRFFQTSLQENFVNLIKIVIFYKFKFIYFRIYLINPNPTSKLEFLFLFFVLLRVRFLKTIDYIENFNDNIMLKIS